MIKTMIAVALAAACAIGGANAQSFPTRPVTILVPLAAGGSTDTIGRIFLRLVFMVVLPLVISALALGVLELGDLRRLIRQYGRTEDNVFPTGKFHKAGGASYGTDVNLPVTDNEKQNGNFTGCLDRKA